MKLFLVAALLAVAAAVPTEYKKPEITIVSQSDVRNPDGSARWSYAGSDGTTRDEAVAQKQVAGYESGNTNQGSTYYISPEGQKITLTWVADEAGFRPQGDHLPTPPPIPAEIAEAIAKLPRLEEPAAYPQPAYKKN